MQQAVGGPHGSQPKPTASSSRIGQRRGSAYPPDHFNWRSYLLYHTDLRASGIRTAEAAWAHYQTKGKLRQTPHIPVLLRYMACQGLFNQMYAHVAAFVLADLLSADVVMPPSLFRWEGGDADGIGVSLRCCPSLHPDPPSQPSCIQELLRQPLRGAGQGLLRDPLDDRPAGRTAGH